MELKDKFGDYFIGFFVGWLASLFILVAPFEEFFDSTIYGWSVPLLVGAITSYLWVKFITSGRIGFKYNTNKKHNQTQEIKQSLSNDGTSAGETAIILIQIFVALFFLFIIGIIGLAIIKWSFSTVF